jgi:hypothetical protein
MVELDAFVAVVAAAAGIAGTQTAAVASACRTTAAALMVEALAVVELIERRSM